MDNLIYLIVSGLAFPIIMYFLTRAVGFGNAITFADTQEATSLLQATHTSSLITQTLVASNNQAALARFQDGHTCILFPMGHKWGSTDIDHTSLARISQSKHGHLHLHMRSYTLPRLKIAIDNDVLRQHWKTALTFGETA
ncbi:MAG: hypothetical protein COA43_15710 [Robiginitomaculum sp.]|nr:MAG: hypothetical protein COA43_15710 [Robiginitomaculum sp.]